MHPAAIDGSPQNWAGFISWIEYVIAFMGEIWKHLFNVSGRLTFLQAEPGGVAGTATEYLPSKGQWYVTGNVPVLTDKGEDIVAALMTIIHNAIVAVAQFTTLLPYEPLSPGGVGAP